MANEWRRLNTLAKNNILDAVVAGVFLVLISVIVVLSLREWILLVTRRKPARLRETEPIWLPAYAIAENSQLRTAGVLALAFALAKELSGQAHFERAQPPANLCQHSDAGPAAASFHAVNHGKTPGQIYAQAAEEQFNGVRRCC